MPRPFLVKIEIAGVLHKSCAACRGLFPATDFGLAYTPSRDGTKLYQSYGAYCKPCSNKRSAKFHITRKVYEAEYRQRQAKELKALAYSVLGGGKCKRCGFDDVRALEIDHVHNDGHITRRTKRQSPANLYREVLRNPENFQVLCSNCNQIKFF